MFNSSQNQDTPASNPEQEQITTPITTTPQSSEPIPQTPKQTSSMLWLILGSAITLLAVGVFWFFANSDATSPAAPPPSTIPTTESQNSPPAEKRMSMQDLFKQICTEETEEGYYYEIDLAQLPLTFSQAVQNKYPNRICVLSDNSYAELSATATNASTGGDVLLIGDNQSIEHGMVGYAFPFDLQETIAEISEPVKVLPVSDNTSLLVTAKPLGHPCQPTDKNIYITYRAHKETDGIIIISTNSFTIQNTAPFTDLIEKYGTPFDPTAEDTGCDLGQQYDFNDEEKIKAFSTEFLDRYFSSYEAIPEQFKPVAETYVNDVMGVEVSQPGR